MTFSIHLAVATSRFLYLDISVIVTTVSIFCSLFTVIVTRVPDDDEDDRRIPERPKLELSLQWVTVHQLAELNRRHLRREDLLGAKSSTRIGCVHQANK